MLNTSIISFPFCPVQNNFFCGSLCKDSAKTMVSCFSLAIKSLVLPVYGANIKMAECTLSARHHSSTLPKCSAAKRSAGPVRTLVQLLLFGIS